MTLTDILIEDCRRAFLTRKQRQAIRDAAAELDRLRIVAAQYETTRRALELHEKRAQDATN